MAPSAWPALIVGAFTILNPSTPAGPTSAETDASTVTLMSSTQPAYGAAPTLNLSYTFGKNDQPFTTTDLGAVTVPGATTVTGTGADGKSYMFTIPPTFPGVTLLNPSTAKPFDLTAIDHMPVVGYGSDPNKMDQMCWWNGTDPNKIDPMAIGYDPSTTKFYNSDSSTQYSMLPTPETRSNSLKNFSPPTPPRIEVPSPKNAKPQSFIVPTPSAPITIVPGSHAVEKIVEP